MIMFTEMGMPSLKEDGTIPWDRALGDRKGCSYPSNSINGLYFLTVDVSGQLHHDGLHPETVSQDKSPLPWLLFAGHSVTAAQ